MLNEGRGFGLVFSCEHARRDVPEGVDLGLAPELLEGHLAWDPGAREVAETLASRTNAALVMGEVSRLVVDLNRMADSPEVIPVVSHGHAVPGNAALDATTRQARLDRWHQPYRDKLAKRVATALNQHRRCLHLSIHSFSAELGEGRQGLEVGVLFDPRRSAEVGWAQLLITGLGAAGLKARPNAPYLGIDDGCTTWLRSVHPDPMYAGLEIELLQGLDPSRSATACAVLAGLLRDG